MPRAPRAQPAKPETPPAPKQEPATFEEKTGKPKPEQGEAAARPRQTQQAAAANPVFEGKVPDIELFKPTEISPEDLEKLNVYQRWNRILSEIGLVPKRGYNAHHQYWFTTDADLNAFIGPLFAKYHIVVLPTILLDQVVRIDPPTGAKQFLTRVPMHIRVVNADKPEDLFEIDWIGEGADTVDKGVYKAFTGGLKYFYMKLLQVATGDDPETFTRTDQLGEMAATAAASGPQQRGGVSVTPSARRQPQKGGRQDDVTEVQERQVRAMSRALDLGPRGTAQYIDEVLNTKFFDTVDGIEDDDEAGRALGALIKTKTGQEIGKVLYAMGQEQAKRTNVKEAEAAAQPAQPAEEAAQPETETDQIEQAQATVSATPPGYEPDEEELGGGYGG